ncbi:MAG: response regulator transcription factor [Bacteroidales bacterium]|nr:response regulator transcription factor [Bacteroidales bacterium]
MRSIKTIIIDDEISAIRLLEEMAGRLECVTVCGYAEDVEEGINLVLHHRPDIVFLDIRLKDENGFDLIQRLKAYDVDPFIVMVTGYGQFGIQALKAGAFDYLLKPVDPSELLKVISRFREKQARNFQPDDLKRIRFNTLGGFILINPEEILYCKAEANYTDIFLADQRKHTISLNIGSIERILANPRFFRISRSNLINLNYLTGIDRRKRLCTLTADHITYSLTISHDRMTELEEAVVQ